MAKGRVPGFDRYRSCRPGKNRVVDGNRCDSGHSGVRGVQLVGAGIIFDSGALSLAIFIAGTSTPC